VKPRPALTVAQRDQRKRNLLLASRLARGQAAVANVELADRADALAHQVVRLRNWAAGPLSWTATSVLGAVALGLVLRRVRAVRLLRWVWPVVQVWRLAVGAMASSRADARPDAASAA
jgi:predicted site-specific integrase-resolvase